MIKYEEMKAMYPQIYLHINEARNKKFWRIKIFAYELAILGDAELMTAEGENLEKACEKAIEKIQQVPKQIVVGIKLRESGREIAPPKVK